MPEIGQNWTCKETACIGERGEKGGVVQRRGIECRAATALSAIFTFLVGIILVVASHPRRALHDEVTSEQPAE